MDESMEQLFQWIDEKKDVPEELIELSKELKEQSATTEHLIRSIRRLSKDLVLHAARRTPTGR